MSNFKSFCRPSGLSMLRFTGILLIFVACTSWILAPDTVPLDKEIGDSTAYFSQKLEAIIERRTTKTYKNKNNDDDDDTRINWQRVTALLESITHLTANTTVALLNINHSEEATWRTPAQKKPLTFRQLTEADVSWKTELYPEWIDEDHEFSPEPPTCPKLPMPEAEEGSTAAADVVLARLPCRSPHDGWRRDVARLHAHVATAKVAAAAAAEAKVAAVPLLLYSRCEPMPDVFPCRDLVAHHGRRYWLYAADVAALAQKASLPVGSCQVAIPWPPRAQELSPATYAAGRSGREAYASILHSSPQYLCGALALARSIRMAGSTRELLLLVDGSVGPAQRLALTRAGWLVRPIRRIRNPRAEPGSYNEWNYSKLRLWQQTDYRKLVFIDADLVVLRSLDGLFGLPEVTATGNSRFVFNSGMMVVEPSACTFERLMRLRRRVASYNGGDQGFLNELYTWWHRVPRRMNFLKHFWSNDTWEYQSKTRLFAGKEEAGGLYVLHYLGIKPWLCYRDYDCNWNVENQRKYASDAAHATWWRIHDSMPNKLQRFCRLSEEQKQQLEWDRSQAAIAGFSDLHWQINVSDSRRRLRLPQ